MIGATTNSADLQMPRRGRPTVVALIIALVWPTIAAAAFATTAAQTDSGARRAPTCCETAACLKRRLRRCATTACLQGETACGRRAWKMKRFHLAALSFTHTVTEGGLSADATAKWWATAVAAWRRALPSLQAGQRCEAQRSAAALCQYGARHLPGPVILKRATVCADFNASLRGCAAKPAPAQAAASAATTSNPVSKRAGVAPKRPATTLVDPRRAKATSTPATATNQPVRREAQLDVRPIRSRRLALAAWIAAAGAVAGGYGVVMNVQAWQRYERRQFAAERSAWRYAAAPAYALSGIALVASLGLWLSAPNVSTNAADSGRSRTDVTCWLVPSRGDLSAAVAVTF